MIELLLMLVGLWTDGLVVVGVKEDKIRTAKSMQRPETIVVCSSCKARCPAMKVVCVSQVHQNEYK